MTRDGRYTRPNPIPTSIIMSCFSFMSSSFSNSRFMLKTITTCSYSSISQLINHSLALFLTSNQSECDPSEINTGRCRWEDKSEECNESTDDCHWTTSVCISEGRSHGAWTDILIDSSYGVENIIVFFQIFVQYVLWLIIFVKPKWETPELLYQLMHWFN